MFNVRLWHLFLLHKISHLFVPSLAEVTYDSVQWRERIIISLITCHYSSFLIFVSLVHNIGWLWYEGKFCNSGCWICWPLQSKHHFLCSNIMVLLLFICYIPIFLFDYKFKLLIFIVEYKTIDWYSHVTVVRPKFSNTLVS